jgi:small subunit ribosomal protein S17
MADEEKKDQEKAPEETPEAEEKAEETAKAEEKAPEAEEAANEEAAPEADEGGEAAAPAAGGDDEEISWKAQRRLERSREPHEAGPQKTPEERAAERAERRKAAGAERSSYRKRARGKRDKGTGTEPADRETVASKIRRGRVVSSKADKTITVQIAVARRHPTYEKVVRRSGTLHAHDERNEAGEGDLVEVIETRPLSKLKRWRLEQIVEKAK